MLTVSEAAAEVAHSSERKLESAVFLRDTGDSSKRVRDESNHKMREANTRTCSLWTLKSQRVQSQYIPMLNEGHATFVILGALLCH